MSNYTQTTNFTALTTTHAVINGAAYDLEYGNVSTAIASKFDNAGGGYNGPFTMKTSGSGVTLTVNGAASSYTTIINGSNSAGNSLGLLIAAGTNASDTALIVYNQANTTPYLTVVGDGGVLLGNAPTGGSQGNGTVNVSGSYYINGVNQFQTGSFTATLAGCTTAPTQTWTWVRVGNIVTLTAGNGALTGTSNATSLSISGIPAAIQPATVKSYIPVFVEDNGNPNSQGACIISPSSGSLIFTLGTPGTAASFTASGVKGIPNGWLSLTYSAS